MSEKYSGVERSFSQAGSRGSEGAQGTPHGPLEGGQEDAQGGPRDPPEVPHLARPGTGLGPWRRVISWLDVMGLSRVLTRISRSGSGLSESPALSSAKSPARAGKRRKGPLSAPRVHTKSPS